MNPNFADPVGNATGDELSKVRYPISLNEIRQMNLGTELDSSDLNLGRQSLKKALTYAQRYLGIDIMGHEDKLAKHTPPTRVPTRSNIYYDADTDTRDDEWSDDDNELPGDDELPANDSKLREAFYAGLKGPQNIVGVKK